MIRSKRILPFRNLHKDTDINKITLPFAVSMRILINRSTIVIEQLKLTHGHQEASFLQTAVTQASLSFKFFVTGGMP